MTHSRVPHSGVATSVMLIVAIACQDTSLPRTNAEQLEECTDCDISLEHIATLGSESDTIWPTVMSAVVRTGDGGFIVGSSDHPGVQLIYSSSGALVRTFGRQGEGPGEYQPWTIPVIGPADTISIVDMMASRRTVIDSIGTPVRTHRLPTRFRSAVFIQNRMIVQADIRTPELIGIPLHEIRGDDGSIVRSFGDVDTYQTPGVDGVRIIAAAGDSGLWVAAPNRLAFDFFDLSLTRTHTMELAEDWFKPNAGGELSPFNAPSAPRILTAWQGEDGILWTIIRVADAEWRPTPPPTVERAPRLEDGVPVYDWILMAIDPGTGHQVGTARFDGPLVRGMGGDGVLYVKTEGPRGGVSIAAYYPNSNRR